MHIKLTFKEPYKVKYELLIKKLKSVGLKHYNDPKAFIKGSIDMDNVYENIDEYKTKY